MNTTTKRMCQFKLFIVQRCIVALVKLWSPGDWRRSWWCGRWCLVMVMVKGEVGKVVVAVNKENTGCNRIRKGMMYRSVSALSRRST